MKFVNVEKYFKEMYADIWQGNNLDKIDDYYAKEFEETISVCDDKKNPIEINMNYSDLVRQALWQKENYVKTTFEIRKIIEDLDNHISVYFYSSSLNKNTGELRHRYVCGIWRLNKDKKIDRVWAVVTPYYPS